MHSDLDLLPDFDALKTASSYSFQQHIANTQNPGINELQRKNSMLFPEAVKRLEFEGKIDTHLSPSDNAVRLLDSALSYEMHDAVRAAIVYALDVLKSDSALTTVPVGLQKRKDMAKIEGDDMSAIDEDGIVLRWLVSNYTPIKPISPVSRRLGFKTIAGGVRFAIKLRRGRTRPGDSAFVFAAEPGEREHIEVNPFCSLPQTYFAMSIFSRCNS